MKRRTVWTLLIVSSIVGFGLMIVTGVARRGPALGRGLKQTCFFYSLLPKLPPHPEVTTAKIDCQLSARGIRYDAGKEQFERDC